MHGFTRTRFAQKPLQHCKFLRFHARKKKTAFNNVKLRVLRTVDHFDVNNKSGNKQRIYLQSFLDQIRKTQLDPCRNPFHAVANQANSSRSFNKWCFGFVYDAKSNDLQVPTSMKINTIATKTDPFSVVHTVQTCMPKAQNTTSL